MNQNNPNQNPKNPNWRNDPNYPVKPLFTIGQEVTFTDGSGKHTGKVVSTTDAQTISVGSGLAPLLQSGGPRMFQATLRFRF